ncbi:GroES-like protein [Aulographum hederae CBS 113979]|uniref:GroES-like protein n=1 Tax=Aulographum hederae CBS 113979 TaxID=1176131 RepID=A0A6G1H4Q6_9PEZI|nr:GroES-like protein [Aulographum hederae CBS 113979]
MKQLTVSVSPTQDVTINTHDTDPPTPGSTDLIIKVMTAALNPKDWKVPLWMTSVHPLGDDLAGIVSTVGSDVVDFAPGMRVAAFHTVGTPYPAYGEYARVPMHMTFALSDKTTWEEACTVPLAGLTAAVGLFLRLGLPEPWKAATGEEKEKTGLVVYGAAGAVGAFVVKLARLAGLTPIVCVAGKGVPFVRSLLDEEKGDAVVDYREGDEAVVSGIQAALREAGVGDGKARYAFDAISGDGSQENIARVIAPGARVTHVHPPGGYGDYLEGTETSNTLAGDIALQNPDFGFVWMRYLGRLVAEGKLQGHPFEVIPGGLDGAKEGLEMLRDGKVSAKKIVHQIGNTGEM